MTRVHDLIDDYDIPGLNQYIHMKNIHEVDTPNHDGVYPIEYAISKFDPNNHNIKTHCVIIQTLLNKGCEMDKELLTEIKNEQQGKVKEFIEMVLEMKPHKKRDRFARPEPISQPRQQQNRQNISRTIPMPKSNYSDQELIQLQQIAEKYGVIQKPVNHLALRIINHMERILEDYGHYN